MPKGVYQRTEHHREILRKSSAWKKGVIPWNKGKHPDYVQGKNNCMFGSNRTGKTNPNWKGGKWMDKEKGYVLIYSPFHPNKIYQRYVYEHRLKIENKIRRYLKSSEVVHHINGNPKDNRIKNLMLCKNHAEHRRLHGKKTA